MNELYHTYEWVMSHIWMSHITHMNVSCHNKQELNESCHTYDWVMSHTWMSHVTHTNRNHDHATWGQQGTHTQHTATHCNTLQHTATHCNTLQHTAMIMLHGDNKVRSHIKHSYQKNHSFPATIPANTPPLPAKELLEIGYASSWAATHCNTLWNAATHCQIAAQDWMREFVSQFAGDMRILIPWVLLCLQYCLPRIYCEYIDYVRRLDARVREPLCWGHANFDFVRIALPSVLLA